MAYEARTKVSAHDVPDDRRRRFVTGDVSMPPLGIDADRGLVSASANAVWPRGITSLPGVFGRTCWTKYGDVAIGPHRRRPVSACPHVEAFPSRESDEELNLGVSALRAFIERFPKHKLASTAHLEIAQSYVERGRYDDAAAALAAVPARSAHTRSREEIPDGPKHAGPLLQLQKKYAEAIEAWRDYLAKHPSDKQWSNVQREIINTEYLMAADKFEAKQYAAANRLFAEFLAKYPLDERVPGILLSMNRKAVRGEEMGRGHRRLAADRLEVSRFGRGLARRSSSSPRPWRRSSASWRRRWRSIARRPGALRRRRPAGHRPADRDEHDRGHRAGLPQR